MSSSSSGSPPRWGPFSPERDCSQGICTPRCRQWCDIFTPPPPSSFLAASSGDDASGTALSPLVIAIIGVVTVAFVLVAYYAIVSKYCGGFGAFCSRAFGGPGGNAGRRVRSAGHDGAAWQSHQRENLNAQLSDGLDQALINKITVCKYKRGDCFVDGTDCSVCLGEFRDGESLRMLPKCSHAFHIQCIDTWLKSHSNCPLCRCNIVSAAILAASVPEQETRSNRDAVVVIDVRDDTEPRHAPQSHKDEDSNATSHAEIAELPADMTDELIVARKRGLLASSIGSSRQPDGRVIRSLHCVAYPPQIMQVSSSSSATGANDK